MCTTRKGVTEEASVARVDAEANGRAWLSMDEECSCAILCVEVSVNEGTCASGAVCKVNLVGIGLSIAEDECKTISTGHSVPSDLFKVSLVEVTWVSVVYGAVIKASIGDLLCAVEYARCSTGTFADGASIGEEAEYSGDEESVVWAW